MAQAVNNELVERFEQFYRDYYHEDIGDLARKFPTDQRSLYVDWGDLYRFDPDLADDYLSHPEDFREAAEEALRLYDLPVDVKLGGAHVRVRGLGETTDIRDIRAPDVNTLIAVSGLVRKATDVRPKVQEAAFECQRCGTLTRISQGRGEFREPHECQGCERQGPFRLNVDQSEFVDSQQLRVQESPEGLRGGETPRSIDVHVEDDLTGEVTPGDHVTVTGVLRLDQESDGDSAVFDTYMEGVAVEIDEEEFEDMEISEADKKEIIRLSDAEDIYDRMIDSIAPTIYGYEQQKLAMALQLFSGVTKELPDGSRIRGDLHMLLIGDPGTGKSQLLQYVQEIAPRSVYTSGKGASTAGLTAAAVQDDFGDGQEWSLEAGALVLADQGIAAVDELDKMDSGDRSAMHEALEQQSYHPDTELLLADGRRVPIGEFVDERMAAREDEVVDGVDCEILPVDGVSIHSVDTATGDVEKLPVDRVSRHEAPEEFVRLTFSNGRSVTVTPEHPTFVDAGDGPETVPANAVEEGAFVPAPRKLPNADGAVQLADESTHSREKPVRLPDELSGDLAEFLGLLVAEGHSYAGSAHEIGVSDQDERLLDRAADLARRLFGTEGTETTNEAGTVTKRWVSTRLYRWFESEFPEVMHTAREKRLPAQVLGASEEVIRRFLVGAFAGDGVAERSSGASETKSHAGVESEAMSFVTASAGLAEDYADALAKLGVATRIHHDDSTDSWETYVMDDSAERFVEAVVEPADDRYERAREFDERGTETRHHDVFPTGVVEEVRDLRRQVGLPLTDEFHKHLENDYGVQTETVRSQVEAIRERIETVRGTLQSAETLAEVRSAADWSERQVAGRTDETTSAIRDAEDGDGGYDAKRARDAVETALADAERRVADLERRLDLRYYRVTDVERVPNDGVEWVYDVTVEPTNTFVGQGVVLHNSVSISKAGINATLKSRCSLLGAANPKYGRFDQYESIGEQIDLEPALISRFDLIFTVTDEPDEEEDRRLAEHILNTNYAGELSTQRAEMTSPDVDPEAVDAATEDVDPTIDPELLRKYIAYAKQNCHPRMTEAAQAAIQDFYTDLRSKGTDEDAPVPVTARKLEATVRLAEASARVRLSDEVTREDADRVIEIVRSSLQDVGVDPESGEFDADVVETGTSKTQRDRIQNIRALIGDIQEEYDQGAPIEVVEERAEEIGMDPTKVEREIEKLKKQGELYQPDPEHIRTT